MFSKIYKNKGFTLVELLVVISIIILLSSVVLSSLSRARMKSRDARRIQDLKQIVMALELFYHDNGYYPQSGCGWDCNGYRVSYNSSWDSLAADLAPYIKSLPKDPLNTPACTPWTTGCYTYSYGNVGRSTQRVQYDLTAQMEDTESPYRCTARNWRFYFDNQLWCPNYSGQLYEGSIN